MFFAYMTFFPQLLAGPIGRAGQMVPQFSQKRVFEYTLAVDGCRQFLWGLFMKMMIADTCAIHTNKIFSSVGEVSGSTLLLGAFIYAFQIYADFSGYSDMAIGCGKLYGIRLMRNFSYPYFSETFSEFWRSWHVSLSTWFRDYLYIPLGGNRKGLARLFLNMWIVFLLSGLWHGAAWTFVIWGGIHAFFLSGGIFKRKVFATPFPCGNIGFLVRLCHIVAVFVGVMIAWVFFRAPSFDVAVSYLSGMCSMSLFSMPHVGRSMIPWLIGLVAVEWIQRDKEHVLQLPEKFVALRWLLYSILVIICFAHYQRASEFIYFKF